MSHEMDELQLQNDVSEAMPAAQSDGWFPHAPYAAISASQSPAPSLLAELDDDKHPDATGRKTTKNNKCCIEF